MYPIGASPFAHVPSPRLGVIPDMLIHNHVFGSIKDGPFNVLEGLTEMAAEGKYCYKTVKGFWCLRSFCDISSVWK